jgi:prepilin-type N-terminal cleavage/methylation domain-containing protein
MAMKKKGQSGFTLIELLVVIAIIGMLSTVAITSLNGARSKARDARRKSDLEQILLAFEQYYADNGRYYISGTGYSSGTGWFNRGGETTYYVNSIADGLKDAGYFPSGAPLDPQIPSYTQWQSGTARQYMVYNCSGRGIYIYAHLERPSAGDLATYTASKAAGCNNLDTYTMNYAVGHAN